MVLDASGNPIVVWQDNSNGNWEIYGVRFDGERWVPLAMATASGGGISNSSGDSTRPSVALDPEGQPWVAWQDGTSGTAQIFVRRLEGTSFVELGLGSASALGVSQSPAGAITPQLSLDAVGVATLVWADAASGNIEIYARQFLGSGWQEPGGVSAHAGGISNTAGDSTVPRVVSLANGHPVVAWQDDTSGAASVYVREWNGVTWAELGAGSASGTGLSAGAEAWEPALVLTPHGFPALAWSDLGTGGLVLRTFDGAAWQPLCGGAIPAAGAGSSGSLRHGVLQFGTDGVPVAAWQTSPLATSVVQVQRCATSSWVEATADVYPVGLEPWFTEDATHPVLGLNAANDAVLAWESYSGSTEIYLRHVVAQRWQDVGLVPDLNAGLLQLPRAEASGVSLALLPDDRPLVVYAEPVAQLPAFRVRRYDAPEWTELSAGIADATSLGSTPAVAVGPNGLPVVAWWAGVNSVLQLYMKRFTGSRWEEAGAGSASGGGISANDGFKMALSLRVDSQNRPVVAWQNNDTTFAQIYVRRLENGSWVELGAGSATGGGISNTSSFATYPSLAIDPQDAPVVAWEELANSNYEIYVRRFDGTSWQELGASSASGGGVSQNSGSSSLPALAVAANGDIAVAWMDDSSGDYEVYAKHFDGVSWQELGVGSATGGGISNHPGTSGSVTLVAGATNRWMLAWSEALVGNPEIYVRVFDGTAWQEHGAGSASGSGVSNSASFSASPHLAVGFARACLTWQESLPNSSGDAASYTVMRCTDWP